MKKRFIMTTALLALLLLLPLSAFAQEDEAEETGQEVEAVEATEDAGADGSTSVDFGPTNTESRVFHVELGFIGGFDLEQEETVIGRTFALAFTIGENSQLGIVNTQLGSTAAGREYGLLRFDYFFTQRLGISLGTGGEIQTTTPAGMIGLNALLVRNVPEDGMSSTLKAGVQYLVNEEDGFGNGTVGVQLVGTIGL